MTAADIASRDAPRIAPPASKLRRWLRRYGLATFGASIILIWVLIALFAPLISRYNPNIVDVAIRLKPPSAQHWLGTDALGRDVYARLIYGSQISLFTGCAIRSARTLTIGTARSAGNSDRSGKGPEMGPFCSPNAACRERQSFLHHQLWRAVDCLSHIPVRKARV